MKNVKYGIIAVLFSSLTLILQSCGTTEMLKTGTEDLTINNVVPKPFFAEPTGFYFQVKNSTQIISDDNGKLSAQYLADKIAPATGWKLKVSQDISAPVEGNIVIKTDSKDVSLGEEGYVLKVKTNGIELTAASAAGLFRGVQTIRQMLPASIDSKEVQNEAWLIPTGVVRDHPRFEWRGVMLDVARHFFGPEDVKKYIDLAAYYKINRFHMHLADDQGWRIEIKSWPKLTEIGSTSSVDNENPGFYTQAQFSDIVKYADERYITLVPEIDMPGHTNAALASYAELNCNDTARALYTGIEVGFSSLCTKKEITYKFVDDVVGEISALTTGKYFHIGGDEALSTEHGEYLKFIERVQKIVNSHNKSMVGWEEIANANINKSTTAQLWRNEPNPAVAYKDCKVIMSPASRIYFDMQYDSTTPLGLHWGGYIDVDKAYDWNPTEFVKGITEAEVVGIEAPLWAETIKKYADIEYMVFPRLPGLAEMGWTQQKDRNFNEYKVRLGKQGKRLTGLGVNFYKSPLVDWK
jgi:hexosaminidase